MKALKIVIYLVIILTIAKCSTNGKLCHSDSDSNQGNLYKTEITVSTDSVVYTIAYKDNHKQQQKKLNTQESHAYTDSLTNEAQKTKKPSNKSSKAYSKTIMSIGTAR